MPKTRKSEERYYEPVRKWLTEEMGYYTGGDIYYLSSAKKGKERFFTRTGFSDLQADVVGIKYSGNDYSSDIKVCVVEVKDTREISRQQINQAFGYRRMAHYVYLAAPAEIDTGVREIVRELGIGFLQIGSKKKVTLIETPSPSEPSEAELVLLLHNLWIAKCTFCQCYFPLWGDWNGEGKTYAKVKRNKVPSVANGRPTIEYEISEPSKKRAMVIRYLCHHCYRFLFDDE